ncbi:DNA polymerase III subunit gamma/tau [Microbacterium esteraromaticum]|uniref:DNA polymerase III subunit gamma/tau n=1 Tax=Microbacterium esteraromaticum TaxID=57043 RepID=UPI001CD1FB9B|nr:DNA polymerase III subunit gamma/tau [Microbacterium esteraromaticum]MCA1306105.1 DNA polymerase III subunit gamma/tau [Microbacterium esteraromaticum]
MSSDPEDDALSWAGDDALEARRPEQRTPKATPAGRPKSAEASAGASDPATSADAMEDDGDESIGTVALLMLGILGGVYLLYSVGWFVGGAGMLSKAMFMLPAPFYFGSLGIAVLAPALWFAAVLVLTRDSKTWVRFTGLIVGALLLVPWPFVVAGGGAAL